MPYGSFSLFRCSDVESHLRGIDFAQTTKARQPSELGHALTMPSWSSSSCASWSPSSSWLPSSSLLSFSSWPQSLLHKGVLGRRSSMKYNIADWSPAHVYQLPIRGNFPKQ